MKAFNELNAYLALKTHAQSFKYIHLNQLKQHPLSQALTTPMLSVDFSTQRLDETAFELLLNLAEERQLKEKINDLFTGTKINLTENRPALHTALRTPFNHANDQLFIDGENILAPVKKSREQMKQIVEEIHSQHWLGYSGKKIKNIVHLGIGGSYLGPQFTLHSLKDLACRELNYYFLVDADPEGFAHIEKNLSAEETLFIVCSKTFTTKETLFHLEKALNWCQNKHYPERHFIAVTANIEKPKEWGITHILSIWEWVGGRYSISSAINLITAIAIGYAYFEQFLNGAHALDLHFKNQPFSQNLPVVLGLIGIWNINFLHIHNLLMLCYAQKLEYFTPYIQQLDMESNGKGHDRLGRPINFATGPIVWGGLGNQAQHSYYQLLCQGTHKTAIDFLSLATKGKNLLNDFCNAKRKVLAHGIMATENPLDTILGNIPSTHIQLAELSPYALGQLIALYEHKIFVQGMIWNINSFDQPGVESAKKQLVGL